MKKFESIIEPLMWSTALLLIGLAAGCGGGGDPILGGGGGGAIAGAPGGAIIPGAACPIASGVTIPTVLSSNPTDGNSAVPITTVGVANSGKSIFANFSLAMASGTINATTFTLAKAGQVALIPASVLLDASSKVATLTTSSALSPNTLYQAIITTGAQSASGVPLACPYAWSFTTAGSGVGLAPLNLGAAAPFGALTCQALKGGTAGGTGTTVNGDTGTTLTSASITNFPPSTATGTIFASDLPTPGNTTSATAIGDSNTARLAGVTVGAAATNVVPTTDLGAVVGFGPNPLTPGTFKAGAYKSGSSIGIATDVTLDAQGNADAVWVFYMPASTLTTTGGNVLLANGAQAKNVYWIVGSSATLGAPLFNGNILAAVAITVSTPAGGIVNGRLQTSGGICAAVDFSGTGGANTVNVPAP